LPKNAEKAFGKVDYVCCIEVRVLPFDDIDRNAPEDVQLRID
jgi:hypothetical protein